MRLAGLLASALIFSFFNVAGQKNWQLSGPDRDKIYGASVNDAYELLKDRTAKEVVVAVIDIGTDINHEDLKDVLWTNKGEIPDNGVDDDKNGYIDDVHGWNFLGGKNGDLMYEATEATRMYQREKRRYMEVDTNVLSSDEREEYGRFLSRQRNYNQEQRERVSEAKLMARLSRMNEKLHWKLLFLMFMGKGAGRQLEEGAVMATNSAKYNAVNADSMRRAVVGDDPDNIYERFYGNNHVIGPEASHGTHTAGIIAANRNNNKGIMGVAANVRIMALRAVPWGDERDKDIANAIRYAVDNGASVINMSFGKYKSPNKGVVDSAVKYALSKDVLLIHSAGNEGNNTDTVDCFPNRKFLTGGEAENWIEVGANGKKGGSKLVAGFSNYGHKTVDLFAPGVNIKSTMPGNKYANESGTSMAGPVVAGVAAIIRGYFPELKAGEVKAVLLQTVSHYEGMVRKTGDKELKLEDMCISGGIVNAAQAVKKLYL